MNPRIDPPGPHRRASGDPAGPAASGNLAGSAGPGGEPDDQQDLADPDYQRDMAQLVTDEAPAVFAVVEEPDDRSDGRIAAWVLEFADRVEAIGTDGGLRMSARTTARVLAVYGRRPGVTARLVPSGRPQPPA
jgi:hypothetical protein